MKNYFPSKKGQVQVLAPAVLALVFAAVVLVFGLVMSQELRDTQTNVGPVTVLSEAGTLVNEGDALANYGRCGFNTPTILGVHNTTWTIDSGNYTVNETGYIFNATDDGVVDYGAVVINYTYMWGGQACESANSTIIGLGTFADFWEIIVLAIVITIVIGLLLVVFGGRRIR